jgi:hypothetical protein
MSDAASYLMHSFVIGAGATMIVDLWAIARTRLFGIPALNYGLVGRWFAHMRHGRFRHDSIAASPQVHYESAIGWIAHYLIGMAYAAVLLAVWGLDWARQPTLGPALAVGLGSVVAPFFLMQPGMGAGIAASRTPRPTSARINTLVTHAIFGFGLFGTAWVARNWMIS